jgi:hypothetical protein
MSDDNRVESLEELKFASLSQSQEESIRSLERQFNNENNTDYYFMVLKRK